MRVGAVAASPWLVTLVHAELEGREAEEEEWVVG